jgi:hypothetical protein
MSAVYGTAVAAIAASLLVVAGLRAPVTEVGHPDPPLPPPIAEMAPADVAPGAPKNEAEPARAKPEPAAPADSVRPAPVPALAANAPDFLVTDPAGYSSTLSGYRGYVALIGVWSSDQPESAANIERLYQSFSANTKLRFVGVTNERQARATNTTFPVVYNQGSRLLGLASGEFVLLDPSGTVELRGSLLTDFDELRRRLAEK